VKALAILTSLAALSAVVPAGAAPLAACPEGLHAAATAELFFARNPQAGSEIGDADWRAFVSEEISPRFPEGVSVTDVYGRGPGHSFVREPSKALVLVFSGSADERRNLKLIREAYGRRFHQRSTLTVEQAACISF
jgi:hypothetical protein